MKHGIFKAMATALAATFCGGALAVTGWSGNGGDTRTSNNANWWEGRADDSESMKFNAGGKTVTFDKYYNLTTDGGYVWIGDYENSFVTESEEEVTTYVEDEDAEGGLRPVVETVVVTNATPVVFESVDGSENYGLQAAAHIGIADGAGQRGALLIKSGNYHAKGDVVVGAVANDTNETAIAFLTMEGGTLEADYWMAIGRHNETNGASVASYITITNATLKLGQGEDANGMIDFAATGSFKVWNGGNVHAPGSRNVDDYGIALAIANNEEATSEFAILGGQVELGGEVCIGRKGKGTLLMDEPGNDKQHSATRLVTTGITAGGGEGTFDFRWGTLVAATSNSAFIERGVNCVIAGNPKIHTAFPIVIPAQLSAPEGGNLYVSITDPAGSLVMPKPDRSIGLFVENADTQMAEHGDYVSFFHKDVFVWDSSELPEEGADVVVPAGASVEFIATEGGLRLNSLRVDGTLTINQSAVDQTGKLLTDTGLKITGTGTLAMPSSSIHLYKDTPVELEEAMTLSIVRTPDELRAMEDNEILLQLGTGSVVDASQVKIANSRRTAVMTLDDDGRFEFTSGVLPPDWTSKLTGKGQIVWDDPVTITGNGDISQEGEFVVGYHHIYQTTDYPNANRTVNIDVDGVTLKRFYQGTTTQEDPSWIAYTDPNYGFRADYYRHTSDASGLPETATREYANLLSGCIKANRRIEPANNKPLDITIKGLEDGHLYLVQIFCMDSSLDTVARATMYVGSTNSVEVVRGEDVAVLMNVDAGRGKGPGQYLIGRFIADGNSQTIRIKSTESSAVARENMILWRDITNVTWDGGNGEWNTFGGNWRDYSVETAIWSAGIGGGYAHGAVVDTPSTLVVTGDVYAAALMLSNDASVTVDGSKNKLHVASDITAYTNATFTVSNGGSVEIGGRLRMAGHGDFRIDAPSVTEVEISAGTVTRVSESRPTNLVFSDTPMYRDETARENRYHALYCEGIEADLPISSLKGNGRITATGRTVTITNAADRTFAGAVHAKTLVKAGTGSLRFFGITGTSGASLSDIETLHIDRGTIALATPQDISDFNYDCDATRNDTIVVSEGRVTMWNDSAGGSFYLSPTFTDSYVGEGILYDAPTVDETIFGGMPGLKSERFRMEGNADEDQSSVFAVMKLTGDEVTPQRVLVDASELGAASQGDPYRLRVQIGEDKSPHYYNVVADEEPENTAWLALNGIYGTNATFSADTASLLTVPWRWPRNAGQRRIAYGWGGAMAWGEIVSYSRALTAEEITAVGDYLMRKWGMRKPGMSDNEYRHFKEYCPFGDSADIVIGPNGTFDAGDQAITVRSLVVRGTLKGAANITVTGNVTFEAGSKLYINAEDAAKGIMSVGGDTTGGNIVTIYSRNSAGEYTATKRFGLKPADDGRLYFSRTGFNIRIR